MHSEAWHSRLVITVKFGGIKLGGLRSSSVAFKLYSEVWWCHVNLVVAVSDCEWLMWLMAVPGGCEAAV